MSQGKGNDTGTRVDEYRRFSEFPGWLAGWLGGGETHLKKKKKPIDRTSLLAVE